MFGFFLQMSCNILTKDILTKGSLEGNIKEETANVQFDSRMYTDFLLQTCPSETKTLVRPNGDKMTRLGYPPLQLPLVDLYQLLCSALLKSNKHWTTVFKLQNHNWENIKNHLQINL